MRAAWPQGYVFRLDYAHLLSALLASQYDGTLERASMVVAERRMAATALAIRLYEVDCGQRPEMLDELVPGYLPAVPQDPYAADGCPIAYLPHDTTPRLYCVRDTVTGYQRRKDVERNPAAWRSDEGQHFLLDGPPAQTSSEFRRRAEGKPEQLTPLDKTLKEYLQELRNRQTSPQNQPPNQHP
jgi:hypothetical protein